MGRILQLLVDTARTKDPLIRDMVLIGSAVYAPEFAGDYDVVIASNAASERRDELFGMLFDALGEVANVDVILRFAGDRIGDLARAILAGRILFGGGEIMAEARRYFDEQGGVAQSLNGALAAEKVGEYTLAEAAKAEDPGLKDGLYKGAFDGLFAAARTVATTFRAETGGRELPAPHGKYLDLVPLTGARMGGRQPNERSGHEYRRSAL